MKTFYLLIIFLITFCQTVAAVEVVIDGPTEVCPGTSIPGGTHTYTVNTFQQPFGWDVNTCGEYLWGVKKDGILIHESTGTTLNYTFDDTGEYTVGVVASQCSPYFNGQDEITVNSRVPIPSPIAGPVMCTPGQNYSFTTLPDLPELYPNDLSSSCFWHFDYRWTAPTGWSIENSGSSKITPLETVNIKAPPGTPNGAYEISVESRISKPNQAGYWYSDPQTYIVQVGSLNGAQIQVNGTLSVCNGNSYTFTANVPGGHKPGYIYSWTYPSGWTVQNQSANTIRLYLPSHNSNYGPVRVSINNGCGSSSFVGPTVFPCNYMMSGGNFSIYPNPSIGGVLNVEFVPNDNLEGAQLKSTHTEFIMKSEEKEFRVMIFNESEQLVKSGETKDGKLRLDTSGLNAGTYYLHIFHGKEIIREQIVIQ